MTDLRLAWLGDDFTGAAAVMEVLAFAGLPSVLFTEPPSGALMERFADCAAVGLATTARAQGPAWMAEHLPPLFAALDALPRGATAVGVGVGGLLLVSESSSKRSPFQYEKPRSSADDLCCAGPDGRCLWWRRRQRFGSTCAAAAAAERARAAGIAPGAAAAAAHRRRQLGGAGQGGCHRIA